MSMRVKGRLAEAEAETCDLIDRDFKGILNHPSLQSARIKWSNIID